jgi:hypothetical protein
VPQKTQPVWAGRRESGRQIVRDVAGGARGRGAVSVAEVSPRRSPRRQAREGASVAQSGVGQVGDLPSSWRVPDGAASFQLCRIARRHQGSTVEGASRSCFSSAGVGWAGGSLALQGHKQVVTGSIESDGRCSRRWARVWRTSKSPGVHKSQSTINRVDGRPPLFKSSPGDRLTVYFLRSNICSG